MSWKYLPRPDLAGKTVVVTGATSGVGRAAATAFAEAGATTVLAVRDTARGEQVAAEIRSHYPNAVPSVQRLDLADLTEVRRAAAELTERHPSIDILVNNAAVAAIPRRETVDGFEMQIGVAHFGHFALTGLLLPSLLRAHPGRVVTVSSGSPRQPRRLSLEDLQSEQNYHRYRAYERAKTANLYFAVGLDRRLRAARLDAVSVSAQPGWTRTNLGPGRDAGLFERAAIAVSNLALGHSPEVGAQPILFAATGAVAGGSYVSPRRLNGLKGRPEVIGSKELPVEHDVIDELWTRSVALTGVGYDVLATPAQGRKKPRVPR
ncbi:oxidoreductase [Leifsonia sp. AG29]|uniref:oxidoreductase n=1 Tax=Leifsonia sp. AG29 TaxID=2598860 RepID=UPI00131DAF23|nr:oxidoreductase [Leifsonia sp. AG29]